MNYIQNVKSKIRKLNHRRIDFLRSFRYQIFLFLFNQRNSYANKYDPIKPNKRILILRLDGKLGDTITITGLLQELHQQNYKIDVITRDQQSFIYDYIKTPLKLYKVRGLISIVLLYLRLRKNNYRAIFCTTHLLDPASMLLARFLTAQSKIVFLNQELQFFDYHIVKNFDQMHITDRYCEALKLIGIPNSEAVHRYFLKFSELGQQKFEKQRAEFDFQIDPYIVLNSFAGSSDRNLSYELTKNLIEEIFIQFPKHHVVSIGSQYDLTTLKMWSKTFKPKRWHILNDGDFEFNAAILQQSDLVISPDTAIIHLASALNCKIVGIFRVATDVVDYPYVWAPNVAKEQFNIVYAFNGKINRVPVSNIINAVQKLILN